MRILYSFPDTMGAPGIGTTALEQVRSLARAGVDVHVAATATRSDPGVPCELTMTAGGRRVRHGMLGRDRAGALRAYGWHDHRVAGMLRRGLRVDAVHCWPQATLRTAAAAARLGIPVLRQAPSTHTGHAVETVAALHRSMGIEMRGGNVHGHSDALVSRELEEYDAADLILVPSAHAAETFVVRGVPRERLAEHRFGCDLDRFHPGGETRPDGRVTVLFAGRGEPAKGLHHALHAWARAGVQEAARLVICGEVDADMTARMGDLLTQPGVELRGYVRDLAPLMRTADLLLLPSLNEGSALVTYEAQACGCVPLVSDACGAPVEHEVHGLVHRAGDESAIAEHLRRCIFDTGALASMRRRVIAARDRLSWDAAADGLVEAYRTAGAGRRRFLQAA